MLRRKSSVRKFYLKSSDDTFVFTPPHAIRPITALTTYKFSHPELFSIRKHFDRNAISVPFRVLPETLLEIALKEVKKMSLPNVYTWKTEDVCLWLRNLGYPQYQNTFRENMVNGRTLLLLDASTLPAINIRDFDHVRHIAYNIRQLFYFEMVKFARSISLPAEHFIELYKLLRVKNGTKYEITTQPEDVWRRMQLIRPPEALEDHWAKLGRWLRFMSGSNKEIIGYARRTQLYKCKKVQKLEPALIEGKPCSCMPPCDCRWTDCEIRSPWKLGTLKEYEFFEKPSQVHVLSVLHKTFPDRYNKDNRFSVRASIAF